MWNNNIIKPKNVLNKNYKIQYLVTWIILYPLFVDKLPIN